MLTSVLKKEKVLNRGIATSGREGGGRGVNRAHRTLGGKSQGKTSSDRQRCQQKVNIKAYVSEIDLSVN
jgi:hypothetical protein